MSKLQVDTELVQLNIPDTLRRNSTFMKILAVLFYYGNQTMDANQIFLGIKRLNLLHLKGDEDVTIRDIIATGHRQAKKIKIRPLLEITKARMGRPSRYCISKETLNGINPLMTEPVPQSNVYSGTKRIRKATSFYKPSSSCSSSNSELNDDEDEEDSRDITRKEHKKKKPVFYFDEDDFDYSAFVFGGPEERTEQVTEQEDDTIADYSLLYSPPTSDMDYIDKINFNQYPTAAYFAIVQQKGYSYPRFRSHEKIKIPKANCEDKFRVTDIKRKGIAVGRLFILADGHGGAGCSEFFVRHGPDAVEEVCQAYISSKLTERTQDQFRKDIRAMILRLDEEYLARKRREIQEQQPDEEEVDNDGCTLILNIFLGDWMINVNVGDSRTILISAPEPRKNKPNLVENCIDSDYKMDVVFASQDHKPYFVHLIREIIENGGEFVDSVQNRVIKIELDKIRKGRMVKRGSLKNARIRPKGQEGENYRVPSLNVARSCGDLDFKMDPDHKIISCEPDVTFIQIKKKKTRYFMFMSTDGTFDYMYEETPDRQNRAISKMIGPMIEDGEKTGKYFIDEDNSKKDDNIRVVIESMEEDGNNTSLPRIPLLYRQLTEEESNARKIKERTLVCSARYFANREGSQGFFSSTLQDYDDCTIILVEI